MKKLLILISLIFIASYSQAKMNPYIAGIQSGEAACGIACSGDFSAGGIEGFETGIDGNFCTTGFTEDESGLAVVNTSDDTSPISCSYSLSITTNGSEEEGFIVDDDHAGAPLAGFATDYYFIAPNFSGWANNDYVTIFAAFTVGNRVQHKLQDNGNVYEFRATANEWTNTYILSEPMVNDTLYKVHFDYNADPGVSSLTVYSGTPGNWVQYGNTITNMVSHGSSLGTFKYGIIDSGLDTDFTNVLYMDDIYLDADGD